MKKTVCTGFLALLMGAVALIGPVHASAQTLPPTPPGVAELVDSILSAVGDLLQSLAPTVSFDIDGDAELFSYGASVLVTGTYACDKTLALDEALPQLTSQSLTVDVAQALAVNGSTVTHAFGRAESFDILCDGADHDFGTLALVDSGLAAMFEGQGEAIVRMRVCDLLGCTIAVASPTLNLFGLGFDS